MRLEDREDEDPPAESHEKALAQIIQGIRDTLSHLELSTLDSSLRAVSTNILCDNSLRWAGWMWMSAVFSLKGDLQAARTASDTAITLSSQIDTYAKAMSLCVRAGVGFASGKFNMATAHLLSAISLFEQEGELREKSLSPGLSIARFDF